jgi:hypothetical protein
MYEQERAPETVNIGRAHSQICSKPIWSLGIGANGVLTLCNTVIGAVADLPSSPALRYAPRLPQRYNCHRSSG